MNIMNIMNIMNKYIKARTPLYLFFVEYTTDNWNELIKLVKKMILLSENES